MLLKCRWLYSVLGTETLMGAGEGCCQRGSAARGLFHKIYFGNGDMRGRGCWRLSTAVSPKQDGGYKEKEAPRVFIALIVS